MVLSSELLNAPEIQLIRRLFLVGRSELDGGGS
jgi:hypothetical protein